MDRNERQSLDDHITGHGGEDQLREHPGDEPAVAFPDVHVQLSDKDGNVFAIIGNVTKALRRAGYGPEAEAFATEAMGKSSYDAVLQLVMRTVETS